MINKTKICSKCKFEKQLNKFHLYKSSKDGHKTSCKECNKEAYIEYKKTHKEKEKNRHKKYNESNKEKIKLNKKKWRELNKEKIKLNKKKWQNINQEKIKEYNKNNAEKIKIQTKNYRKKNKERVSEYHKNYYKENKERLKQVANEYYNNNKLEVEIKNKKYRETHKKERNEHVKRRKQIDPLFGLSLNISNLIRLSLKKNGFTKKSRTHEILGCSFEEFKQHIESKFEPWMNWDNRGSIKGKPPTGKNQCWDIDHIIPTSSAKTEEEIMKLNHYTNLQPLCSYTNRWIKKNNL